MQLVTESQPDHTHSAIILKKMLHFKITSKSQSLLLKDEERREDSTPVASKVIKMLAANEQTVFKLKED